PRERNVVIFGKTGSGKSSIINTIVHKQLAKTSNDVHGCTSTTQRYPVEISGQRFTLIDTAGLNLGVAKKAEKQLKSLLRELLSPRSDGIDLLVYCVRCMTSLRALVEDYTTFYSGICRRVPIVIVVTGLEKMTRMENWWDTNRMEIESLGMHF
ncbi:P-loop containing nucleoside triphosphate hydrolase protein, partial [Suillus spraguei]